MNNRAFPHREHAGSGLADGLWPDPERVLRKLGATPPWCRNGHNDPDEPFSFAEKPGQEATTDLCLAYSIVRDPGDA